MMNNIYNKIFRVFVPAKSALEIKNKYNIPSELSMKIRFTENGYFVLTCNELPGLITEAKNGKELIRMFNDAVLSYFDVPKLEGDIVFNKLDIDGHGTFLISDDSRVAQLA
ncbi:hypothetical protein K8R66_05125 [bacterium]|nr:hypothetical protein [bacterium]